uniref:A kinase-anchoring proteins AKAP-5 and AKAP-12 calmodulin (CaM)-binding domain-containing protein n=1 Tax=Fundulus heteroclitus TaxID=8078 RepID=A0A3Q2Q4X0_FUNHE
MGDAQSAPREAKSDAAAAEEEGEEEEREEQVTQAAHDKQHDEDISPGVQTEKELDEVKTKEENLTAKSAQEEAKAPTIVVNEITNSQEIAQESPLKRLLSGSSFKKLSKKQKGRKSSDAKLSDSGEHVSDQLLSSAESAENKKAETPGQTSAEAAAGEDGAWFSFKKLVTPQKKKKSSVDHEEGPIPGSRDGAKSVEGEQISDHSTEEGKRRKDSSVSWEAVLCGSGRRRSRKTSDSEDETPQVESEDSKQNGGSKQAPLGASTEMQEVLASAHKQTGGPPEGEEGSTWRSFKKLVTPKRKMKDEEESNSDVGQDDSAFSIKRLLSGRKTRKSVDVSADEVSKDVTSISDEDSETPAVVPLSEFDLTETETDVDKESCTANDVTETKEEVQSQDTVPAEAREIPDQEGALEKEASSAAATTQEPDELTESSEHQQLSDIPEEGFLTETTPASVMEEAVKDETIAEDLLEITSEAMTAPEPADVTLADDTEMVSAVSRLSESSKTSGNTTPVPAEYDVMDAESLLQQVSETISVSPKAVPVCLEEPSPERVVGSVLHQILEPPVLDQPKILELHRGSEATCIKTGLHAEGIDAVNEAAAVQAESMSHLNEAILTEMASEVPKEELDTAEPAADEVCELNLSELQKEMKALLIPAEEQHVVEDAGAADAVASRESSPEEEEEEEVAATEEVLTDQAENDRRKAHSGGEQFTVTSGDDTEKAGGREEVDQTVTGEDTETKDEAFERAQNEAPPPAEVDELEELGRAETAELAKGESDIQSHEERPEEKIWLSETPSQDLIEGANENNQIAEAQTYQSLATELEKDMVQTLNTEVSVLENISTAETDTDEPKPVESLPEGIGEADEKEPQNYQSEVTGISESVQAQTLEPEDAAKSPDEELSLSGETKQVESLTEETKEEEEEEKEEEEKETAAVQIDGSEVTGLLETQLEENAVQSLHKQVSLPDISPAQKYTEESKLLESLTEVRDEQDVKVPDLEEAQISQSEVTEEVKSVQAPTLESQRDAVLSLDKEVLLEDISPAETEESKQVESPTKLTEELEDETKTDSAQSDNAELGEELKSIQTPTAKSEEDVIQTPNKDIETDIQEQKEDVTDELEDNEPPTGAAELDHVEELICPQAPILHSEEAVVQSLNKAEPELVNIPSIVDEEQDDNEPQAKKVTQVSEVEEATLESVGITVEVQEKDLTPNDAALKTETAEEKTKEEPECATQSITQVEDAPETEHAQEPEAALTPSLGPEATSRDTRDVEVMSCDTPAVETVTDELVITESNEPLLVEQEASPPNAQDMTSDVETCQPTTAPRNEESKTQELQDVPEDTDIVTEEPDRKAVSQETDTKPCDAEVEHEENAPEDVEGMKALTAVHISSVNEGPRSAEVLEKTTCLEETQPDCVDMAEVPESKNEVSLCEQQERVVGEKAGLLSDAEIKVATTDQDVISHEVLSNIKDFSTEKPNVVVHAALMGVMASETEFIDTVETATPLVPDYVNQEAESSIAMVTMRMPSVEIEVNHKFQVLLMDVDVRSAENAVDTVVQVGVTEDKEVIDVCHESIQKVENLSATAEIEEGTTSEAIQVTVQDVMEHWTSDLPGTPSKMDAEDVEEVIKQSETMTEVCETDGKESVETEDKKGISDGTETVIRRQDEETVVITENSGIAAEQEGLEESKVLSIVPQTSDASSINDPNEDLEEVQAAEPEVFTTARDVGAEELAGKDPNESTREPPPSPQRQIATPGNAALAVPQSAGVISSSTGNLESPSSLSLEFKLNIQFAQAKTPTWPSAAPTEKTEPMKPVEMSEAGVQAEAPVEPVCQGDECKKQTELNEVAVQASSNTEPDAGSHLIQRALIASQPVLQDVGIQAVETTEPVEQIQSTERADPKVQAAEVSQPSRQEKRAVLLSKPLLSEVRKVWAFRQSEDENDQDVWLDAEEDIYPQQETRTSRDKAEEHAELQSESEQKEEAEPELEFEMACGLETADTESQRDALTRETCEIESEGEDFAVALEDLGTSVSAVE